MKIGYLFSRYPVPSQTFCDTEMRALEDAGAEVEIFSCSPPLASFRHESAGRPRGPVFYAPPERGLAWERTAAQARGTWPGELIRDHETRFGARHAPAKRALHAIHFAALMAKRGIAHVHVHFAGHAAHTALFLHAASGLPFSFTAHAQDFLVDLGNDDLLREMCAKAAFAVAVSDFSRRALAEKCPASEAKIFRVYNGLPLSAWPLARAESSPAGPLRIFSAGRLIEFKGFDDLVEACDLLRERGVECHCDIAGEGPMRAALEGQIARLGLEGRVRLLGLAPRAQVASQLAEADVFALACRVDGAGACDVLPTVILEAMAAGKPVVSTRLAAVPEMVEDGVTGFLAAPGRPTEIADALARLAVDAPLRARMGQAGRARMESVFTAEAASARLLDLFSKFAGSACPRPAEPDGNPSLIALLDRWPDRATADADWLDLRARVPASRFLAFEAGPGPGAAPAGQERLALIPWMEYLPDAMVIEAQWRESAQEAHRIEEHRRALGGSVDGAAYLDAARRALFLWRNVFRETPAGHLHAVGMAPLLCAWILVRLGAARSASFRIEERKGISGALWERLTQPFVAPEAGVDWQTALAAWSAMPKPH